MTYSVKHIMFFAFLSFFAATATHGIDIRSWWDDLDELNGFRITLKVGGWNFWYKNDAQYMSADPIGYNIGTAIYNEEKSIRQSYNMPILGVGVRFPVWKLALLNVTAATSRVSVGAGIGVPIGGYDFNVTPWATAGFSFTNGTFFPPATLLESGIDVLFLKYFIVGGEFVYSGNPIGNSGRWNSINYGLSIGAKLNLK